MPQKETRNLTVTVDGDERDATWKEGVGIYVAGFDTGKGDVVGMEGEAMTLTVKARELE